MTTQENAVTLYTQSADLYQRFFMDYLHYDQAVESYLREKHVFHKGMKVLDAGTGTGILLQALYYILPKDVFEDIDFVAFDITESMLQKFTEWLQENTITNVTVFRADVLDSDTKLRDNDFDIILSSGMLEYVSKEDFPRALTILSKKLKKKGILLLFISRSNILSRILLRHWWKANIFTKKELLVVLKKIGYSFITFDSFPRPYQYVNWCMTIIETIQ